MNNHSIDPARIDWYGDKSKRAQDEILSDMMASAIQRATGPVSVVCLPAAGWLFERHLMDAYPDTEFRFLGVERDPRVCKKTKNSAEELESLYGDRCEFRVSATSIREAITAQDEAFDVVYLDYMGTWSREKQRDISAVFRGQHLWPTGCLLLTLGLNRGQKYTHMRLRHYAELADMLGVDYMDRVENRSMRCSLAKGSISRIKVTAVPVLIQQMASLAGHALEYAGGVIYDSFAKNGSNKVAAEMTMCMRSVNA